MDFNFIFTSVYYLEIYTGEKKPQFIFWFLFIVIGYWKVKLI